MAKRARPTPPKKRAPRGKGRATASKPAARRRLPAGPPPPGETTELLAELTAHSETGPPLTGGDLDADWERAYSSGEEAVGGSVATPDQDVVDEIGRALGVEQPSAAPVRSSGDMLRDRDSRYWDLERRATKHEDAR